jgi:hypothetical protein
VDVIDMNEISIFFSIAAEFVLGLWLCSGIKQYRKDRKQEKEYQR